LTEIECITMDRRNKQVVNSVIQVPIVVNIKREANVATMVESHSTTAQWLAESIENYKRKLGMIASNDRRISNKKTKLLIKKNDEENIEIDCKSKNNNNYKTNNNKPLKSSMKASSFEQIIDLEKKSRKDNRKGNEKSDRSLHPRYLFIMAMKVVELRRELKSLNINSVGLKKDLQKRLLDAIEGNPVPAEILPTKSKPSNSKIFFAKPSDDESLEESREENEIIDLTSVFPAVSMKVELMAVGQVDSKKLTTKEEVIVDKSNEKKPETMMQEGTSANELKKLSTQTKYGTVKTTAAFFSSNKNQLNEKSIVKPSSFKSVKQTLVQSKSQRQLDKSPKKSSNQAASLTHAEPYVISKATSLSSGSSQPSTQSVASTKIPQGVRKVEVVTLSSSMLKKTSSKANGGEISNTAPFSMSVKEKHKQLAEARKQRLAEMRSKSKPLIVTKPVGSSKKYVGSAIKRNDKRTLMTAKIREKHAALKNQGIGKVAVPAIKGAFNATTSSKKPLTQQNAREKSSNPSPSAKSILSPHSTYEISDRGEDSSSDESDESNQAPKKKVPSWAQKQNLLKALHEQYDDTTDRYDPDFIFPEVETCDLAAIFNKKKNRYKKRASTGNWLEDRVTAVEVLTYKRDMGFSTSCSR